MMLMLGVGCPGVNQCGPLQASTLTLGVVRLLNKMSSLTNVFFPHSKLN